jgi:hypothetical protein
MYNLHTCNSELILKELGADIDAIDKELRFNPDPELVKERENLYDLREHVETTMAPRHREPSNVIQYDDRYYQIWRSLNGGKIDENL